MMVKEFKYCENPEADVPRMFIDKEIGGKDDDGLPNIDGNIFLKELIYLSEVLQKKRIEVWINSPGGIVTEGQSIYAAIINSRCPVDTICYGIAASIAGVIFQAGRKRIMLDYTYLMYHPAYSEDGKQDKMLEALNHSICTMIAKRTGKSEEYIWSVMNKGNIEDKGTWIGSDEAYENGFCDDIRNSDNQNEIKSETIKTVWKSANKIFNRTQTQNLKTKKMKQVLNKLGLVEDASEASVLAVLDAKHKTLEDLQKKHDDLKKKLAECEEEIHHLKNKHAHTEAHKADDAVKKAVAEGKIKNDASLISSFKTMLLKDYDTGIAVIDALPVNKTAPFIGSNGARRYSEAEQAAIAGGLKPATGAFYNAVKTFQMEQADKQK